MENQVYIGPAGWSYPDWYGTVYPKNKKAVSHPLSYIAEYFNLVEINTSFYYPPSFRNVESWIARVAHKKDFLFTVKLWEKFTHKRQNITEDDVTMYRDILRIFAEHGRLGALLVQFPWSFTYMEHNLDYLMKICRLFRGFPLAVEIRHSSWKKRHFFELLNKDGLMFCNIDQPEKNNFFPPTDFVTADGAYLRLHGRNSENWWNERDMRYNYCYSGDELEGWREKLESIQRKSLRTYIVTNNHYRGQAVANAFQIKHMITGKKLNIPPTLLEHYSQLEDIALGRDKGLL